MTDNEVTREKTFSEELLYFKGQLKEVFDYYDNPKGCAEMLYLSVLSDSNRLVRKVEEEINRQQAEIEKLERTISYLEGVCESIPDKVRTEAIKEFWGKLKKHSRKMQSSDFSGEFWDRAVLVEDGDNLVKEMVVETE